MANGTTPSSLKISDHLICGRPLIGLMMSIEQRETFQIGKNKSIAHLERFSFLFYFFSF